jgi:DNA-binding GntR family transcriptional regulator
MKVLSNQPNLVEQVREALMEEIASGKLAPGERVVQDRVAQALGVSRQPVQQALALLLAQGVLRDAPGHRLVVAPLDPDHIRSMYDMRAVVEGLACRRPPRSTPRRPRAWGRPSSRPVARRWPRASCRR